jgi:hypothetical protein
MNKPIIIKKNNKKFLITNKPKNNLPIKLFKYIIKKMKKIN